MKNLTIINQNGIFTVDSREVAEMIDKEHSNLMRDIRGYIEILNSSTNSNLNPLSFFIPGTYQDIKGEQRPCYQITKKGCDLVANKMTGEKGVLFTATYVTKFEEMEQTLKAPALRPMSQAEILAGLAQVTVEIERTANMAIEVATKTSRQITNVLDIFTAPVKDTWRHDTNEKINKICLENGLSYLVFKHEMYTELENVAKVNLKARQLYLRQRMKKGGSTYAECKAISKLDIIERDAKLKPIFEGIVRKYQVKYASMSCTTFVPDSGYSEN